ncbi:MAG: Crossover junction endodeoxyribonuclease RuvC [Candidatus Woesebacteria bacterium GW2011_GWA1_39_8]|uniref:Crossover junction endodeoxyribonuclease RuvC n=1 Tax=Candidatus Woesebacteria bacterium GW2011_GWA1_39_8 TaxID=1618552 RepID=A0A0G0PNR9_9BACT|nr:MAG: Crossover junction endodeoxyribonuclease RuvC [Candidatus Woesebacteria bacterium GW2011_GWA1_39_8]
MKSRKFTQTPNKILGIDPGYGRIGIAVIEKYKNDQKLIYSECFETDAKLPHYKRLFLLGEKMAEIIKKYNPQQIAIETLLWSKNKKTALQVAEARGVILLEAARNDVLKLIKIGPPANGKERFDDEYDAIAIALTCSAISLSTDMIA